MMKHRLIKKLVMIFLSLLLLVSAFAVFASATDEEATYKAMLSGKGFPASYHDKLWQIHQQYPNWNFEALNTGLDWNTVVANESLTEKNTAEIAYTTRLILSKSWGTYNADGSFTYMVVDGNQATQTGHVNTTPMAVAFFMDPRNFFSDVKTMFQFEELTFDASAHTLEAVEKVVQNSFMNNTITYTNTSGTVVNTGVRYAQIILDAGRTSNVNPCYLAGKIIQEVGNNGSGSVSGIETGYVGYYNFFNIGAYASSTGNAIKNGLERAKKEGWDSPEKSIRGGTTFIADRYIAKGQSTAYLQKFNVNPSSYYSLYTHQYMSAINDPSQSSASTYSGYVNMGTLSAQRSFLIPVFNNMPEATATAITLSDAVRTGVCNSDSVNIRSNAGVNYSTTGYKLNKGTQVEIIGGYRTSDLYPIYKHQLWYPFWYYIRFTASDGTKKTGYVCEDYIDTNANLTLSVGATRKLGYSLFPLESTEKPMFMSVDTRIAKVDANGNVTAVATGTTKIVAFVSKGGFDVLPVTVVNSTTAPTSITSPVYTVSSGYIKVETENTTVSTFKSKINGSAYMKVYNASGADITATNGNVGTGCIVKLMNGSTVVQTATVVLRGDVNGDGKVNITDMLGVKAHILGSKKLASAYSVAGNYNKDSQGTINITDFIQVKSYLLNK